MSIFASVDNNNGFMRIETKKIEERITQEDRFLRGSALGLHPQAVSRKFH